MTLLQTRVTDEQAEAFETVAKRRKESVYSLLARLVAETVKTQNAEGWETQADKLKDLPKLPFGACEKTREGEK